MEHNFILFCPASLPLSTLIVENDKSDRDDLREYLGPHSDIIAIEGIASTFAEAIQLLNRRTFGLSILDYKLDHYKTIFNLFAVIKDASRFGTVVFTSNYPDEINAYDLLEAPFDLPLHKPIDEHSVGEFIEKLRDYLTLKLASKITYKVKEVGTGRVFKLADDDILFISAGNNEQEIHCTDGSLIKVRQSLESIQPILNQSIFMQTHRGYIINTNKVVSSGSYMGEPRFLFFDNKKGGPKAKYTKGLEAALAARGVPLD